MRISDWSSDVCSSDLLMGLFGIVALVVNVAAALVLIPHRTGDANVRAVWLFSRNDAIGNAAVVVAAGLVAWTGTAWPDLVVAAVIAGLFMQSSWVIIRDARAALCEVAYVHPPGAIGCAAAALAPDQGPKPLALGPPAQVSAVYTLP